MPDAEITTRAASAGLPNEDAAASRGDAVVLMDGAGLPAALRQGCPHPVDWFARACVERYLDLLQDRSLSMQEALAAVITQVAGLHRDICDLDAGSPSATVVAVRRAGDRLEHLVLCDSSLGLVGNGEVRIVTDNRLAQVRHPLGARLRRLRGGLDPAHGLDQPGLLEAWRAYDRAIRNRPEGFWCVGHRPEAAAHALTGSTPLEGVESVVLASDGAMRLAEVFGELTPGALVTAYAGGRVGPMLRRLREVEDAAADDSRRAWRKPHDDATVAVWHP